MKVNIDTIRRTIEQIVIYLLIKAPYFGLLLKSIPIYENKKVKLISVGKGALEINPEAFLSLPRKDQIFALLHALTHLTLLHPFRIPSLSETHGIDPMILNYFSEFIVDRKLANVQAPLNIIPRKTPPPEIEHLFLYGEPSIEEIADILTKNPSLLEVTKKLIRKEKTKRETLLRTIPLPDIIAERTHEPRILIKPGSAQIMSELDKDDKQILASLITTITDAYVTAKQAGQVPGWLERIVNSLLEPKINWRALLRYGLRLSLGKRIRRTYSRPNKKYIVSDYYLFPSKRYYGGSKALILVDTSGSINQSTLDMFFSEIYGIFKFGGAKEITVLPWDADVHEPIRIRNLTDFERIRVVGMGGTRLLPAIKKAFDMTDQKTIVIILSDFEISELGSKEKMKELKNLMIKVARKSLKTIMVTTSKRLDIPYWDIIKLD